MHCVSVSCEFIVLSFLSCCDASYYPSYFPTSKKTTSIYLIVSPLNNRYLSPINDLLKREVNIHLGISLAELVF